MTELQAIASGSIRNVFIVEPDNQGWIIEHLMRDIAEVLERRGIPTRIGPAALYDGEDVIFNSRYLQPFRDPRARINALFVTHVDDRLREIELRRMLDLFDSFVCLSQQDAEFVASLKGNAQGVIGIDLPPRDMTVRPTRIGMFSACYADGRKNENWITEYFRERPRDFRDSFTLCFLGSDWEKFCREMADLDLNYEVYRYARSLPGEYQLYKEILSGLDVLVYLGFDGGAMSAYDGVSANIQLILTNISYHRALDDEATLIDSREDFFAAMDRLNARVVGRRTALSGRSAEAYVGKLLPHWEALSGSDAPSEPPVRGRQIADTPIVQEFRQRYKPLGYSRIRSALIRRIFTRITPR